MMLNALVDSFLQTTRKRVGTGRVN